MSCASVCGCHGAAAAFENTVQALYAYVVPKPREKCSKAEQLTVSFAAGYIAGVFCAVVSHPAGGLHLRMLQQLPLGVICICTPGCASSKEGA